MPPRRNTAPAFPAAPAASTAPFAFSSQVSRARRFYLELNASTTDRRKSASRFAVVGGGWEECLPEYDLSRAGFPYQIVEFVSHGRGSLVLNGRTWSAGPGTVFSYGKGVRHRITAEPEAPFVKYFAVVAGSDALRLLRECHILPGSALQILHHDQLRPVFDDFIAYGLSDHVNRSQMCNVTFHYLAMKIGNLAVPHGSFNSAALATYQRCRLYIEENFLAVRTLSDIAAGCRVDPAYLCRLFKRFRRQSPYQYLQNLQMNHAADLLQGGMHSVKETASKVGFTDPYNFSRTFKRIFGISPARLLPGEQPGSASRQEK